MKIATSNLSLLANLMDSSDIRYDRATPPAASSTHSIPQQYLATLRRARRSAIVQQHRLQSDHRDEYDNDKVSPLIIDIPRKVKHVMKPCNKNQRKAIMWAILSNNYSLIKGYPGSGKSVLSPLRDTVFKYEIFPV